MTISAGSDSVLLGNTLNFTANVTGTTDTTVMWSVNQIVGGNSAVGMITAEGVYTAPADVPGVPIAVTATSHADATKSADANVSVVSDITLAVTPGTANVELGAVQTFHATVTSAGHPDAKVKWSVGGPCAPNCGTVDGAGNYTAPAILPANAAAIITAQSVADLSKQVSASAAVTSHFTLRLTAPSSVAAGAAATIVATLTPIPGSNPSDGVSWSLSGPGCSALSCGTITAITTQSTGSSGADDSATYTAPSQPPTPNAVTITATSTADTTKQARATLSIQAGLNVSVAPATATLAANHRITLTAEE